MVTRRRHHIPAKSRSPSPVKNLAARKLDKGKSTSIKGGTASGAPIRPIPPGPPI